MSEPNQDIEKKLKRYAEQRRKDAGGEFELHPATRNLLHGEVARTFANAQGERRSLLANLLWPRLAIAAAFTAILVATIVVLNTPTKHPLALAKIQKQETVAPEGRPISQPKEAIAETKRARKINPATTADRLDHEVATLREESSSAIAPATPPVLQSNGNSALYFSKKENTPARQEFAGLYNSAPTAALEKKVAETAPSNLARDFTKPAENSRWFFQENLRAKYRRNLLSPEPPKVLQSFQFLRNGDEVRLIESDGSVYSGKVVEAQHRVSGRAQDEAISNFDFRVSGTNQQLNSLITFTGNFAETNAATAHGRIEGKVSLGGSNEFFIRAMEKAK